MQDDSLHNEKQPDRTVPNVLALGAIGLGIILRAVFLSVPVDGSYELLVFLAADVVTITGVVFLLYSLATSLWRRWRKHPKPHASPGLPTLGAMFVVWAILVPVGVFGALALFDDEGEDAITAVPTPTVAATVVEANDLSIELDIAAYRSLLDDQERVAEQVNVCWAAIGRYEGVYEKLGEVDGITVDQEGQVFQVFLERGAPAEARSIFASHEALRGDEDRMYAVWNDLKDALKREGLMVSTDDVLVENERMSSVLTYYPFSDEEWEELRPLMYEEREATQHYQNAYIRFLELLSPGCPSLPLADGAGQ